MDSIYLNIVIKMAVAFCILLVYINLSGKGSLAPISALDQVGNVVLGAIIGGPLYNPAISVYVLIIAASIWAGLLLLVRYLSFKRNIVKNTVDGNSISLMENGKILSENFAKAKLSTRDFIMLLHQRGYPNIDTLKNVWFEYNGQMTIVKKGDTDMAITMIENSDINQSNLKELDKTEEWLMGEVAKQGYTLDDIFLAEMHENKLWIYPYSDEKKQ
ncbi:uncharacterized membrane protein YcaP (DUF421 family) [Orbus hercynius]|uniref:Uncharacterized membrane protein YcaP (DUF421 family) n=1 Tax=Orbus hercynius TaxID=593135 RepID=A0A495RL96_9GAMM|nr:YetF domain-containing protein [Orbus hercynius]RKS87568.1 uncharacterized membrane protein YcaP (DUF421 family) [Orbus hercynius]